jgi:ligand-binding SRPBCC domain-containing protein
MRDFVAHPIHESIHIHAPIERCWALSTRIELVQQTLGMSLIDSPETVTSGHITANSRVHWRGFKFGLPTNHHTLITAWQPPHTHYIRVDHHAITKEAFFQDTQEQGRFGTFQHDHHFREQTNSEGDLLTVLRDEVRFTLPFGLLGRLAASLILAPHIERLARKRFALIKQLAETQGWREWVSTDTP